MYKTVQLLHGMIFNGFLFKAFSDLFLLEFSNLRLDFFGQNKGVWYTKKQSGKGQKVVLL